MTLSQIKEKLRSLVIEDLGEALEKFESILTPDSKYRTPTILHHSNFVEMEKEVANQTIPNQRLNLTRNTIRAGLLEMIKRVDEDHINLTVAAEKLKSSEVQKQLQSDFSSEKITDSLSSNSGIYISYAWGGESEKIVDLLDTELQKRNVKLIRDKRDLGYRGSIIEFMKDIGKGNKIIIVISEKYLKSDNCMFELTQIYENKDFSKRIFPIVLEDADIYKPLSRIRYIKYWEGKIAELDEAIKSLERGTDVLDLNKDLNNYNKIRTLFSDMSFILKDMNTLSPEMHRNQNFESIYQQLM